MSFKRYFIFLIKRIKRKAGRRYLKITYVIKEFYPKCTENSQNSVMKKQTSIKSKQDISADNSLKKMHRWQTSP